MLYNARIIAHHWREMRKKKNVEISKKRENETKNGKEIGYGNMEKERKWETDKK